jgi:hypothetical protein
MDTSANKAAPGSRLVGEKREGLELTQFVLGGLDALLEVLELLGVFLVALGLGRDPVGKLLLGVFDAFECGFVGFGLVRVCLYEGFNVGGAEADDGLELRNERFGVFSLPAPNCPILVSPSLSRMT